MRMFLFLGEGGWGSKGQRAKSKEQKAIDNEELGIRNEG